MEKSSARHEREPVSGVSPDAREEHLQLLCQSAIDHYGLRLLDNIDLTAVPELRRRAPIIANALMERGDARAFKLAREIQSLLEVVDRWH